MQVFLKVSIPGQVFIVVPSPPPLSAVLLLVFQLSAVNYDLEAFLSILRSINGSQMLHHSAQVIHLTT